MSITSSPPGVYIYGLCIYVPMHVVLFIMGCSPLLSLGRPPSIIAPAPRPAFLRKLKLAPETSSRFAPGRFRHRRHDGRRDTRHPGFHRRDRGVLGFVRLSSSRGDSLVYEPQVPAWALVRVRALPHEREEGLTPRGHVRHLRSGGGGAAHGRDIHAARRARVPGKRPSRRTQTGRTRSSSKESLT